MSEQSVKSSHTLASKILLTPGVQCSCRSEFLPLTTQNISMYSTFKLEEENRDGVRSCKPGPLGAMMPAVPCYLQVPLDLRVASVLLMIPGITLLAFPTSKANTGNSLLGFKVIEKCNLGIERGTVLSRRCIRSNSIPLQTLKIICVHVLSLSQRMFLELDQSHPSIHPSIHPYDIYLLSTSCMPGAGVQW